VRPEADDVSGGDADRQRESPPKRVPDSDVAATDVLTDRRSGAPKVIQARGAILRRIEGSGREREQRLQRCPGCAEEHRVDGDVARRRQALGEQEREDASHRRHVKARRDRNREGRGRSDDPHRQRREPARIECERAEPGRGADRRCGQQLPREAGPSLGVERDEPGEQGPGRDSAGGAKIGLQVDKEGATDRNPGQQAAAQSRGQRRS
jgi:hypothetical protein